MIPLKDNPEAMFWFCLKNLDKTGFARVYYSKKKFTEVEARKKSNEFVAYLNKNINAEHLKIGFGTEGENYILLIERRIKEWKPWEKNWRKLTRRH